MNIHYNSEYTDSLLFMPLIWIEYQLWTRFSGFLSVQSDLFFQQYFAKKRRQLGHDFTFRIGPIDLFFFCKWIPSFDRTLMRWLLKWKTNDRLRVTKTFEKKTGPVPNQPTRQSNAINTWETAHARPAKKKRKINLKISQPSAITRLCVPSLVFFWCHNVDRSGPNRHLFLFFVFLQRKTQSRTAKNNVRQQRNKKKTNKKRLDDNQTTSTFFQDHL